MFNAFAAIMLLNGSLFAITNQKVNNSNSSECVLPENPIEKKQCSAAYNLPAAIQVSNQTDGYGGLFFDASYTYWYAGEEGLELGRSGDFLVEDDPFFNAKNRILSQPFKYESGFKVGAGWIKNDWVLSGEYTWVRNDTSKHSSAPTIDPALGTGVWVIAPWFLQVGGDGGSLSGTELVSKWHLGMDIADLTLSRPYYQGRHLTITPFGGLRAAWIRQKLDIALTEVLGLFPSLPSQPIHSFNRSNSWSIGPRFGIEAHFLLGHGLRIEGKLASSLLFTEYTKIFHKEDAATVDAFPPSIAASIHNKTVLRAVLESGLGVGWGSYLCSNRYHIDFSADYDFSLWWNQNMIRKMMSTLWNAAPVSGDLYLQGLTLTARFSF